MAGYEEELNEFFHMPAQAKLPSDVLGELQSTIRLHSMTPQELFFKWESYSIKMGLDQTKLNIDTVRALKKDIQETLDQEARGKSHLRGAEKRTVHATPRAGVNNDDVFGIFDEVTPKTPHISTTVKRKGTFETPAPKSVRSTRKSSPSEGRTSAQQSNGTTTVPFNERQNAGQVIETLNDKLDPISPPAEPFPESRATFTANSDTSKFKYRPLAVHLSEASEILDDRIDEFTLAIQKHHNLEDSAFGSAASKSTSEVVTVGRIASDTSDAKLNAASMVLEMSRRAGAGLRVPLKFANNISSEFFPGQIVALRGTNASGEYFAVDEVLEGPMLPPSAFLPSVIENINERLGTMAGDTSTARPLNLIVSAGPYTADDNLSFEPLRELCNKATSTSADVLILIGPFLDVEHPLIASGDFELPDDTDLEPDIATLTDVFRVLVGDPLRRLAQENPSLTMLLVPSARDAVNKHVSWPQAAFDRKGLGLPAAKRAMCVPNPVTVTINDMTIGISAQDILWDLRSEEVNIGKPKESNLLTRLSKHVIQQGHYYPLFPPANRSSLTKPGIEDGVATGTPLDTAYLKLGEFANVRPDLLVLPSVLPPFLRVTEGVFTINPGTLSKKRGPGTYVQMTIYPRSLTAEESATPDVRVGSFLYDRTRADVIRI